MARTPRLAAAAVGLFVFGCLGSSPTQAPRLFVLDATAPAASGTKRDVSIGVGPVTLPKRLDRPQILTRITDHEVELAEFDQWAEPLDRSFARAVAENISRSIPTDRVAVYPWNRGADIDWRIEISVTRFEREADGGVTLAARWRVIRGDDSRTFHRGASRFREIPDGPTVDALVAAMSRVVGALSSEIAAAFPAAGG